MFSLTYMYFIDILHFITGVAVPNIQSDSLATPGITSFCVFAQGLWRLKVLLCPIAQSPLLIPLGHARPFYVLLGVQLPRL